MITETTAASKATVYDSANRSRTPATFGSGVTPSVFAARTPEDETRRMPTAFSLVRDCPLPDGSIAGQVDAVRAYYWRVTGRELPYPDAIRALDKILADRPDDDPCSSRPIPTELAPVVAYMESQQYSDAAILVTIREIERTGTARLSPTIEGEDVAEVDSRIPQAIRAKSRFEVYA